MKPGDLFYSGTSGLVLPVPQSLYPDEFKGKSRLTYYASLFNSVEINSSFYKNPKTATITKWVESVPGHFQFTFKLSKAISHAKNLAFNSADVQEFMDLIMHAGDKKGCLLVQFPPSLKMDHFAGLERLLMNISEADQSEWKIAVEFRNTSWYINEVYDLLDEYNACMVIHDLPASASPRHLTTDVAYLRFHGPGGRYRGSYTDDFLAGYVKDIRKWMSEGKTVYCYFNNTMGDAIKNLETLNEMVRSS